MYRVVALLALCALSACSQGQLEYQTDAFNRASATTITEQTLLNAVRASLDMPMSFTKLQKFTAENGAKGSLAPISSSVISPQIFGLGPTLNLSTGVDAIEYVDVNISGALAKLNKTIGYDTIERYIYQGYEDLLVYTIFMEHVSIHPKLMVSIEKEAKRACSGVNTSNLVRRFVCQDLSRIRQNCRIYYYGHVGYVALVNRARTKCDFLRFQHFLHLLILTRYDPSLQFESSGSKSTTITRSGNTNVTITNVLATGKATGGGGRPHLGIRFGAADVDRTFKELEEETKRVEEGTNRKSKQPFEVVLRSPKSVLTYLGELISLQNFAKDKYEPESIMFNLDRPTASPLRVTLFRVVRGQAVGAAPVLSVRGPDGGLYVVPRPEYGAYNRDQTLRVLGIASELVNGAIGQSDFPAPASIIVRSR